MPDLGIDPGVGRVAVDYLQSKGIRPETLPTDYAPLNPILHQRVASAYQEMPHSPRDPETQAAYRSFIRETKGQWDKLAAHGFHVQPWQRPGQPYANSREMRADVTGNKHLWVFTGGDIPPDHPLAGRSGVTVDGVPFSHNDVFRAVHDIFGHALYGNQFGPRGEEHAYRVHRRFYSPLAQRAMATETRGQNSWVNFGPHSHLPVQARPFAEQKAGLLPEDVTEEADTTRPLTYAAEEHINITGVLTPTQEHFPAPGGDHFRALSDAGYVPSKLDEGSSMFDAVIRQGYTRLAHHPRTNLSVEVNHEKFPAARRWVHDVAPEIGIQNVHYVIYGANKSFRERDEHLGVDYAASRSPQPERIVQAAFRHKVSGKIFPSGPFHTVTALPQDLLEKTPIGADLPVEDGFLTNRGRFLDRLAASQLVTKDYIGRPRNKNEPLISEDLHPSYAAPRIKAPNSGAVVRGVYYPGGKFVPEEARPWSIPQYQRTTPSNMGFDGDNDDGPDDRYTIPPRTVSINHKRTR